MICILEVDSPSYPPSADEYRQCGCTTCLSKLNGEGMKLYLGDGVYVEYEGDDLVLTTENGFSVTNRIVLEVDVLQALLNYVARIASMRKTEIT